MKNIFVTGITGLLGTNLVIDCLEKDFRVKALLRNKAVYKEIEHHYLELIQGNLNDDLSEHLKNIDIFIHIAAETNQGLVNYADYQKINFEATVKLFQNCVKCGVKKFIFVSTANTMGFGSLLDLGNEEKPIKEPFTKSHYVNSKLEAEVYLLSQLNKMDVIIVNPTFMLGAHDSKPSSGRIILMAWKKRIVFYPPGGKNFVSVKDASQGIINSIELGKSGEKYLLANKNQSYKDFFLRLNAITNQKPIMISLPKWILLSIGYFGDILRRLNMQTSISLTNMKILCINNYFDNQKSRKELKVNYRFLDEAIKDTVNYFTITK